MMMHFMLVHVTILLILAFFILFAASKADGLVRLLGYVLGVWLVVAAVLHVAAPFVPGMSAMHEGMMHERWMHHWDKEPLPTQVPAPAQPATPAAPPASTPPPAPKTH